jgi:vitamin B12 transporter
MLLLVLLLFAPAPQQTSVPDLLGVSGTVRDATGLPLPAASIRVAGKLVATSDAEGRFQIHTPPGGALTLVVSAAGFANREVVVQVRPGAVIDVVLSVAAEAGVRVTAAAQSEGTGTFRLEPIHVYRTPGAQGDALRALQALPGVASPDEGAGLFVRGGDASEALVSLDDAVMAHPYRYETPTGGFRGAVDPFQIAGLVFSTGGFSARYGNVLSSVLDLRAQERPATMETTVTAGLAGASVSAGVPLGERAGVRGAMNRTFTSLLFAVNRNPRRFDPAPDGWDGSAGATWYVGGGRLKAFALVQRDHVGVEIERDAFLGVLESTSRHRFMAVRWDRVVRDWETAIAFGDDEYDRGTRAGVLDLSIDDRVQSWRAEATRRGQRGWRLGANGTVTRTVVRGVAPLRGGDLGGVFGNSTFGARVHDWFGGLYAEGLMTTSSLAVTPGVRIDRFGHAGQVTVDPRVDVRLDLPTRGAVRLATGIYRQTPAASYFDGTRGADRLPPMRAVHYVVGYESGRQDEGAFVRAEAYLKSYDLLPLEDAAAGYVASGHGSARGVDVFSQWLTSSLELRGSASWSHARRRWTPADQQARYELPDGTWAPDFDIPWTLQLIANVPLRRQRTLGLSWRAAAGRPHTPVVGATAVDGRFAPVFGGINSDRMPRYERIDAAFNWLLPVGSGTAIVFVAANNVLGRNNGTTYAYAPDYSSRRLPANAATRSFYAGITFRR